MDALFPEVSFLSDDTWLVAKDIFDHINLIFEKFKSEDQEKTLPLEERKHLASLCYKLGRYWTRTLYRAEVRLPLYEYALMIRQALAKEPKFQDPESRLDLAKSWYGVGNAHVDNGHNAKGIPYYKESKAQLMQLSSEYPENDMIYDELVTVTTHLGSGFRGMHDPKALEHYQTAFKLLIERYPDSADKHYIYRMVLLRKKGNVERDINHNPKSALHYYEEEIQGIEEYLSLQNNEKPHTLLSILYRDRGINYLQLNNPESALADFEQAKKLLLAIDPENAYHSEMFFILNGQGDAYLILGDDQTAEKMYQLSLEINKRLHSDKNNHPDLATSLYKIGKLYEYRGEYRDALDYYEQAVIMYKETLEPGHGDINLSEEAMNRVKPKVSNPLAIG